MELRIFIEPQQGATYDEQLAVARQTERAGLDALFRSDHLQAIGPASRPGVGPTDSWVTLAGLARETSRIRLGTLMSSATFRHPGLLAVSAAEVDQMSDGRLELGIGAGWYEQEHLALGVPFGASVGERFERLEEQLEILTGFWNTPIGSRFNFSGKHYQLQDCPALPKPAQAPLPIIVGGRGTKTTPLLAARYAKECNLPFQDVESAQALFGHLDAACEKEGRDPRTVIRSVALTTIVGVDREEIEQRAGRIGRDTKELSQFGLVGTPERCADRLAEYAAVGVSRVYLQCMDLLDLEQIALVGSALLPLVSGL